MKSSAFTLIELLVVVAILAVIASIAVVNFLNAQVRSKNSRVQNDFRVSAIALEAYHVDNGMYPLRPYNPGNPSSIVMALPFSLTTPVAYLSGKLSDPYGPRVLGLGYKYLDWANFENPSLPQARPTFHDGYLAYGAYSLFSDGPDLEFGPTGYKGYNHVHFVYDSTNGTKSLGDLQRSHLDPNGLPQV